LIPLNDFKRQWADTRADALEAFEEIGASGWYILGREVREFEHALARYWGLPHVVGVASGLDAIEISLKALGCGPGDKVLTTPLSAFATALAILNLGAVPVFVDTDEYGQIDLDACQKVFESRPDVRFFVPVHLYGHSLDMKRLKALRERFDCLMVEDCVQSIGACYKGTVTGSAGQMSALSFYPTKNLGALGDGGAVLTANEEYAQRARMLRDYGQSAKYRHELVGYNSRLDELHAGLLRRVSLGRLPAWTEARRRIAAAYIAGLRNPAIRVPGAPAGSHSCWHLFPVIVAPEHKHHFMSWLASHEVGCGEHYPISIPDQPAMAGVEFEIIGDLDTAQNICRSEVSLPIHPYLRDAEIARVIDACNQWLQPNSRK
jgi:dTDP-3-amino-3,4,6-trideoxy-alpha-D-glucose transaminase